MNKGKGKKTGDKGMKVMVKIKEENREKDGGGDGRSKRRQENDDKGRKLGRTKTQEI